MRQKKREVLRREKKSFQFYCLVFIIIIFILEGSRALAIDIYIYIYIAAEKKRGVEKKREGLRKGGKREAMRRKKERH